MSNWLNLKAAVQDAVKSNGNGEITGQSLQKVLLHIIDSLGQNATFAGVVTPESKLIEAEGPVFYMTFTPGIYTQFGNAEVKDAAVINFNSEDDAWEVTEFSTGSPLVKDLGYMTDADAFQFLSQPANIVVDAKCNAPVMFGWHNENGNSLVVSTSSPKGAYQTLFSHASESPANSYGGTATRTLAISADNAAQVSEWERLIPVQQTSKSGSSKEFVTHVADTDKAVLTDMGFNASTTGVIVEKTDWKGSKRGISQFPMATSRQAGAIDASTYDRIQSAHSLANSNKSRLDALGDMSGDIKVTYDSNFHINKFTEAGVYVLESADRMRMDDGLPILNSGPGHNISFRLFVLNSSLPDNEDLGDVNRCVTQVLMLSNRTGGDGDTYIRTGRAKTYDLLQSTTSDKWEPWGKQQQNIQYSEVLTDSCTAYFDGTKLVKVSDKKLTDLIDNGIYSGFCIMEPVKVNTDGVVTTVSGYKTASAICLFTMVVFNNYALEPFLLVNNTSNVKSYKKVTQLMMFQQVGDGKPNPSKNETMSRGNNTGIIVRSKIDSEAFTQWLPISDTFYPSSYVTEKDTLSDINYLRSYDRLMIIPENTFYLRAELTVKKTANPMFTRTSDINLGIVDLYMLFSIGEVNHIKYMKYAVSNIKEYSVGVPIPPSAMSNAVVGSAQGYYYYMIHTYDSSTVSTTSTASVDILDDGIDPVVY